MKKNRGLPVGSRNIKLDKGTENEHMLFLEYSHYDTKYRRHYSIFECKHCGKSFSMATYLFGQQKSCGCVVHNKYTREDNHQHSDLLKRRWV